MTADCPGRQLDRDQLLVTGAGGLTGGALCRMAGDTFAIHAVSRQRKPDSLSADVCWHQTDLSGAEFVLGLPQRIDQVVHLAQSSRFREFPAGAPDVFAVNVAATARLLDWASGAGAKRFVHASSGAVYPPSASLFRESDPLPADFDRGFYAATKRASEVLAASYVGQFSVTALRPFFIYGPGQEPSMLVPRLVRSVRDGLPIRAAGGDGFRFTPIHVSDAVRAVLAALRLEGANVVNVGGPDVLTLRQACDIIGVAVGVQPVFDVSDEPVADLVPDLSLMRQLLVPPVVGFAAGLEHLRARTTE